MCLAAAAATKCRDIKTKKFAKFSAAGTEPVPTSANLLPVAQKRQAPINSGLDCLQEGARLAFAFFRASHSNSSSRPFADIRLAP
jgi:hypothetical protein